MTEPEEAEEQEQDWMWRQPVAEDPEALSRSRRWAREYVVNEYGFTEEQAARLFPLPDEGET